MLVPLGYYCKMIFSDKRVHSWLENVDIFLVRNHAPSKKKYLSKMLHNLFSIFFSWYWYINLETLYGTSTQEGLQNQCLPSKILKCSSADFRHYHFIQKKLITRWQVAMKNVLFLKIYGFRWFNLHVFMSDALNNIQKTVYFSKTQLENMGGGEAECITGFFFFFNRIQYFHQFGANTSLNIEHYVMCIMVILILFSLLNNKEPWKCWWRSSK